MDLSTSNVLFAFALTLFAGLSTGFGSLLSLITSRTNTKFLSFALGFSAGVMIYVSMIEIFPKAHVSLSTVYSDKAAMIITVIGFFVGMLLIGLIDKLIPSSENPHEVHTVEEMDGKSEEHLESLNRMGIFTALAIAIHNFPEGLATFMATLSDPKLGIPIAAAVAIHNIPEGIAVAVPIFYATGSRKSAFKLSFLSGLTEPIGALVGYFLLRSFINEAVMGIIFAAVAGIMVFISLDELLPSAREYGEHHLSIYGVFAGMVIMATSLILFM